MFRILPDGSIECETAAEAIALAAQMKSTARQRPKDRTEQMDTLATEIVRIMREIPLPVHARTIRRELQKRGVAVYGQDPGSTVRNTLMGRPCFEQVGRALYQLAKEG
jgi:hypothetical protein